MSKKRATCRYALEKLEERRLLAGITILTHGYNSSGAADSWVDKMGDAIADRLGGHNAVAQFTMTVTGNWITGPTTYAFARDSGTPAWGSAANPNGEAIIKLDWSNLDHGITAIDSSSTTQVGNYVANVLLNSTVDGRNIAEVPIHLIGHSRGASLLGQLAKRFGEQGIWVDQFTMLDPHPVDGVKEPALPSLEPPFFYYPNFGDAPMTMWDNIVYADNYWRDANANPLDFAGESVSGANNYGPLTLPGGAFLDHTDVHSYYHGTIDRDASTDSASDPDPISDSWYGSNDIRATTGYNRSRIGRGARSGAGVSSLAGGGASRTHVALTTNDPYSNIGSLSLAGGSSGLISNSDNISLNYRYQDMDGGGSVSFYLDDNTNPYDSYVRWMGTDGSLPFTGPTPNVGQRSLPGVWSSAGLSSGLYNIYARITSQSGQTRYAYIPQPLYVTPAGAEIITKQWTGDVSSDWADARNWTPGGVPTDSDSVTIQLNPLSHVDISSGIGADIHLLSGTITWSNGSIYESTLTIAPGAIMNIGGNVNRDWTGTLYNSGLVSWSGNAVLRTGWYPNPVGLVINNLAGGTFELQGDATIDYISYSPQPVLNNAGIVRKSGTGTTNTLFACTVNNIGTVAIESGTLSVRGSFNDNGGNVHVLGGATAEFRAGGESSGSFTNDVGAIIYFGGHFDFDLSDALGGIGLYIVTGQVGTVTVANLQVNELGESNVTVTSAMIWTAGGIYDSTLTIAPGAAFNIDRINETNWTGTVNNSGTINWTGNGILTAGYTGTYGGALIINNLLSGVFAAEGNGTLHSWYSALTFNNAGIFRKSSSSGATSFTRDGSAITFNNTGTVEVQSGTLYFSETPFNNDGCLHVVGGANATLLSGSTSSGSFDADAGGTVNFLNGSFTLTAINPLFGAGCFKITGSELIIVNGIFDGLDLEIIGGTLRGILTLSGTMNWSGSGLGGLYGLALTIVPAGVLNINTIGESNWTGTVNTSGTINWSGNGILTAGYTGTNGGALIINNLLGGVFSARGNGTLHSWYSPLTFNNAGIFRKSSSSGTTSFTRDGSAITFNNAGTVEVQSGTLYFSDTPVNNDGVMHVWGGANVNLLSGATSSGSFIADAGGTVSLLSGSFTLSTSHPLSGTGSFKIAGGDVTVVNGIFDSIDLEVVGGTLRGILALSGTLNWMGSGMGGLIGGINGLVLTIAPSGVLNINTTGEINWTGTVNNAGTINWTGNGILTAGYTGTNGGPLIINNLFGGIFSAQGNGTLHSWYSPLTFNNAGIFRKSSSSGTTSFTRDGSAITFNNTGTVEVQSGTLYFSDTPYTQSLGNTRINGGTLSATSPISINGGYLTGMGAINGSVVNGGIVSPGSSLASLTINGNYTQTSTGRLDVEIAGLTPGTQYDQLIVTGTATLNGRLNLIRDPSFNAPGYAPAFIFLAYSSHTGGFTGIDGSDAGGGLVFAADYNPTFASLMAVLGGDANRDRIVDINDLYALASNWQGNGKVFSQGDFNYDGRVDAADLGILASHWQATFPLPAPAVPISAVRAPARRTPVRVVTLIE